MNESEYTSRIKRMMASDSGMALAVVMLMSAILFMLATTILMLVEYREAQSTSVIGRNQAMHIADAGLNQYIYQLSNNYDFHETQGTLGPTQVEGGTWVVTPSTTASGTLRLTSVGTLQNGYTRTITADVYFPGWNKYIVLVDEGPYSIGAGATFYGDIHCNGGISNSGVITGMATAGPLKTCTAGTSFAVNYPGGYKNNQKKVDFAQITTDLNEMKVTAQAAGAYYPLSGALGYDVVLNGAQATIYKVTKVEERPSGSILTSTVPLGTLTKVLVGTAAIPSDGVLFFDDDVWVTGNYSAGVTIATSKRIWCPGNIVPTNSGATVTCGLVAQGDILFPYWYETMPQNQIVQTALLSQNGGVGPDDPPDIKYWKATYNYPTSRKWGMKEYSYTPPLKDSVTIKGSRAMKRMLGFSSGYEVRNFDKDPVLANNPPPLYPKLQGAGVGVTTWTQN